MYQIDISKHVKECRDNTIFLESRIYDILNEYIDVLTIEYFYILSWFNGSEITAENYDNKEPINVGINKIENLEPHQVAVSKILSATMLSEHSCSIKTDDPELFSLLKFTL